MDTKVENHQDMPPNDIEAEIPPETTEGVVPEQAPATKDADDKKEDNKKNWIWPTLVILLIIVASVAIGLAIAYAKAMDDAMDDGPDFNPSPMPSPSPSAQNNTQPPGTNNPFQDDPKLSRLFSILDPIITSEKFYLNETQSPESKAWHWLAEKDLSVDTNKDSTPEWKIIERYVLAVLYYSTNGDEWTNNLNFLSDSPVCDWRENESTFNYGIRLCSDGDSVTMLHIENNNLQGPIPSLLGLLSNLVSLELPNNGLTGTIPSSLGNLSKLSLRLDLSKNQLEGSIPSEIGNLVQMKELFLQYNRLEGSIPSELAIESLENLNLGSNMLNQSIPAGLGGLKNLEYLKLDNNLLSGSLPEELGELPSIRQFHVQQNRITGIVPQSFRSLVNNDYHTYQLYLFGNDIQGNMEFMCPEQGFCGDGISCYADCLSEVDCSCCNRCYATEVQSCSRPSPNREGCRMIMDDTLNEVSVLLEAKTVVDPRSWHFNKDFPWQVTDKVDSDDPWVITGWIDIQDGPIWFKGYMGGDIGVPETNCSTLMKQYKMRNDRQLRFIPLEDYPCTEYGKSLIYFLIMEWFYFG